MSRRMEAFLLSRDEDNFRAGDETFFNASRALFALSKASLCSF